MAVATLLNGAKEGFVHQARYDLESAMYVAVQVVATVLCSAGVNGWNDIFTWMAWGTKMDALHLVAIRRGFWTSRGILRDAKRCLSEVEGAAGIGRLFLDLAALGDVGFGASDDEDFAAAFESGPPLGFPDLCSRARDVFRRAKDGETAWWKELWAAAHEEVQGTSARR